MLNKHHKEFMKQLESYGYGINLYEKFREFCKVATYSLASAFYPELSRKELEPIKIAEDKKKLAAFENCFQILVNALEEEHQDFLGVFFGMNDLGNVRVGQFFTPYNISLMIARMQINDQDKIIKQKGFIKVCEPACGSGGMIIALRQTLLEDGFNPSTNMYVEMTDIDELCFYMSYIQISLYGIPARVIQGDTLSFKVYRDLFTPVYFLNHFYEKLRLAEAIENMMQLERIPVKEEVGKSDELMIPDVIQEVNQVLKKEAVPEQLVLEF
jgi:type I restriction-modification system DNA methylase subunit